MVTGTFLIKLGIAATLTILAAHVISSGLVMAAIGRGSPASAVRLDRHSAVANGHAAEFHFEQGNYRLAEAHARRALYAVPIYPRAVRSLAFAIEMQGNSEGAAEILSRAALLGWRDIPTQMWLMLDALKRQDWATVALRGDAIARQGFFDEVSDSFKTMIAAEEGRALLVDRLAAVPAWRREFLHDLARYEDSDRVDSLLGELAGTEGALRSDEVGPYLDHLMSLAEYSKAEALWKRSDTYDAALDNGYVYDGGFREERPPTSHVAPFEWRFSTKARGEAWAAEDPFTSGRRALAVETQSHLGEPLMSQMLVLSPGSYRLTVHSGAETSQPGGIFRWRILCWPAKSVLEEFVVAPSRPGSWAETTYRFDVPGSCSAQELQLRTTGVGGGGAARLFFKRVSVEPLQ